MRTPVNHVCLPSEGLFCKICDGLCRDHLTGGGPAGYMSTETRAVQDSYHPTRNGGVFPTWQHQRWMTTRADRGARAPVRWLNSTGSVVPAPQHVAVSLQLQYPFGTHGYIALRCLFDPDRLLTQLVTQTYPCEKGVHHQYGCLSRWIVTTDLPSEAERGMDLQPSDLHAPDLLGRCRHTCTGSDTSVARY